MNNLFKKVAIYVMAFACGIIVGGALGHCTKKHMTTTEESNFIVFKSYYDNTEILLDSIENHYSICDAFDEPVQEYLWARHDVDSIFETIQK